MIRVLVTGFAGILLVVAPPIQGQELPAVPPEEVGISSQRLSRIDEFVERHIEANHFAGAVTLVSRHAQVVQFEAYGMQDIEGGVPMARDSIFRIYSSRTLSVSSPVAILRANSATCRTFFFICPSLPEGKQWSQDQSGQFTHSVWRDRRRRSTIDSGF